MIQFQESKFIQKLISISILLLFYTPISLQQNPTFVDCYNSANYTSNGQFEINLNTLLPDLASNGVLNIDTFYNTSIGSGEDRVYGFAQCMSGATINRCREYLKNSTVEIVSRCPNRRQAVIRYYDCILRYSDEQFVSKPDSRSRIYLFPIANVTDPVEFNKQLGDLMRNLQNEAASNSSKLAVGTSRYNDFQNIYAMAQCTRDLSGPDCHNCIDGAIKDIPDCCNNKQGGNVYSPSCSIRYELYSFYPASGLPPPPAKAASPPPPVRAADSPSSAGSNTTVGNKNSNKTVIIVTISLVAGAMLLVTTFCTICFLKRKKKLTRHIAIADEEEEELRSKESQVFDLGTLKAATGNFSDANKLGEGGFGPVYKGKLPDGQEIAVKRLLMNSSQGMTELKNEIALIAKLEHRNLVRLLGCCLEQGEKLLVYEYVANTSLDKFLFDPIKCVQLDWARRYKIIKGIARGLLYLHEDSRLRIIHRDLKASNVLLDNDMNPKISDFGLAKIFGGDQTQGNTSRVAGTFGYMAPEYVMHGRFSTKTDVFSFGVLVLEIVTGRKNSSFGESEVAVDLLSYTWKHWSEGTIFELINQTLGEHCPRDEVLRCVHIGLLCVQEDTIERPIMSTVVLMLSSYSITLPLPHPPAFFIGRSRGSFDSLGRDSHLPPSELVSQNTATPISINELSITELDPR